MPRSSASTRTKLGGGCRLQPIDSVRHRAIKSNEEATENFMIVLFTVLCCYEATEPAAIPLLLCAIWSEHDG